MSESPLGRGEPESPFRLLDGSIAAARGEALPPAFEAWAEPEDEWESEAEHEEWEDEATGPGHGSGRPRSVGVPFAPDPPPAAVFPVRSSHPRGPEINYVADDGTPMGSRSARRFGASRPVGGRRHCGVDLFANADDEVVACEDGTIIAFYRFLTTTYALLVAHAGVVVNYGEVAPDSLSRLGLQVGCRVRVGQPIARIGVNPAGSSMLHFETYVVGTTRNRRWPAGHAAPTGLLDPTRYLLHLVPAFRAPTPAGAPGTERLVLHRGGRGPAVQRLQAALTSAGFPVRADGDFGAATDQAVRAFQQARGLRADGTVGARTWAALEAPLARESQEPATPGLLDEAEGILDSLGSAFDRIRAALPSVPSTVAGPSAPSMAAPRPGGSPAQVFDRLWSHHPAVQAVPELSPCRRPDGSAAFGNQCAIRLGVALTGAGLGLEGFGGAFCWFGHGRSHPLRVEQLATWLQRTAPDFRGRGEASYVVGERQKTWRDHAGRRGVVAFIDFWGTHHQGDHIDLWDGNRLAHGSNDYFELSRVIWFWPLL